MVKKFNNVVEFFDVLVDGFGPFQLVVCPSMFSVTTLWRQPLNMYYHRQALFGSLRTFSLQQHLTHVQMANPSQRSAGMELVPPNFYPRMRRNFRQKSHSVVQPCTVKYGLQSLFWFRREKNQMTFVKLVEKLSSVTETVRRHFTTLVFFPSLHSLICEGLPGVLGNMET